MFQLNRARGKLIDEYGNRCGGSPNGEKADSAVNPTATMSCKGLGDFLGEVF